jgi:hypothetical protein
MSLNHQQLLEQQNHATAKAEFDAAVALGLLQIYRSRRELVPCVANDNIIKKYFGVDEVALETQPITVEGFDLGYEQLKSQLAMESEQQKRDRLEKQIFKLLPNMSQDAKDNLHNQYAAKMASHTLSVFDEHAGAWLVKTESMELKLQNLITGKEHEDKTTDELTAEVAKQRTIVGGYPPLAPTITKFQLRMMSVAELKKTIQKFGLQQINQRLAELG